MNISTLRHFVSDEPGAATAYRKATVPTSANADPDRWRLAALVAALALIVILLLASLSAAGIGTRDKPGDTLEPAAIVSIAGPAPVVVAP